MNERHNHQLLASELADMARQLSAHESVQDTLDSVAAHAVKLVNGCETAAIAVVERHRVRVLSATDAVAQQCEQAQTELGEGPCLDAASVYGPQSCYRIRNLHKTPTRWPRYRQRVCQLGVGSMLGFRLSAPEHPDLGCLELYSSRPHAFGADAEHTGWALCSHAAVALSHAHYADSMNRALASSRLIGEAIGVMMARYHLTEHAAFAAIRRMSQTHNIKVRHLATTIITTGGLPEKLQRHRHR